MAMRRDENPIRTTDADLHLSGVVWKGACCLSVCACQFTCSVRLNRVVAWRHMSISLLWLQWLWRRSWMDLNVQCVGWTGERMVRACERVMERGCATMHLKHDEYDHSVRAWCERVRRSM